MSDAPCLQATLARATGAFSLEVEFSLPAPTVTPWTVLFGPSGAGKTSLLRLLAGLARPDTGRVVLHQQTLVDTARGISLRPGKRGIGYVSQRPALFPHMTVTENVSFGLGGISGMDRRARGERVAATLALFSAGALADKKPAALSGGEQQRVALARALAPEPRLLLLDEPFTGLDGDLKDDILAALTAWLTPRRIPALLVSHDVADAWQTGAEVLVMEAGRLVAQGPAARVLQRDRAQLLRRLQAPAEG